MATNVQHLPGPWFLKQLKSGLYVEDLHPNLICVLPMNPAKHETAIGNGNLIAASPELFEILRDAPPPIDPDFQPSMLTALSEFLGLYDTWFHGLRQYVLARAIRGD